jgi:hypothetical protein
MKKQDTAAPVMEAEVKTCSIKMLPEDQWIASADKAVLINPVNAPAVQQLRQAMPGTVIPPQRLALLTSKYWGKAGVRLTVGFMDNPPADLRARIISHMNSWNAFANVTFTESSVNPQVRISRIGGNDGGYWSYLGTDVLSIAANMATMNLEGFTMNTPDSEFFRVVRHETGHTLGFPHEHMRTEIVNSIDREKAIELFMRTQGWTREEVINQVLTPISQSALIATQQADPRSIMCYSLPGSIMKNGVAVPGGADIDSTDAQFAASVYPKTTGIGPVHNISFAADAQGDLHVCAISNQDGLWHTIRKANGAWPFRFGDVQSQTRRVGPNPGIGTTPFSACATNQQGDLHVLAIDNNNGLWHTSRKADGSWPFAFGDVQAQTRKIGPNPGIGGTPFTACATNQQGDLHVLAIDKNKGLWHSIRKADGSWPFAFGDVQAQTRKIGPNPGIGVTPFAACATNQQGDLHILAIDKNGGLWHTNRKADGTWPAAFGDVQAQTKKLGPNPGIGATPFTTCATNQQGDLHVLAIDTSGGLWHTMRTADGKWPFAFGDVQAQTRKIGPNTGIGRISSVTCAVNKQGDLHIGAIDLNGKLWHTIRQADGSWPFAFGDVQGAIK